MMDLMDSILRGISYLGMAAIAVFAISYCAVLAFLAGPKRAMHRTTYMLNRLLQWASKEGQFAGRTAGRIPGQGQRI